MSRTLVIADIHGAHRALRQVLERADFDPEEDLLISLGDITDNWPESAECVEELLGIRNLVAVKGNHAFMASEWRGMTVVDVSDPAKPRRVATLKTRGYAQDVRIHGALALIANGYRAGPQRAMNALDAFVAALVEGEPVEQPGG